MGFSVKFVIFSIVLLLATSLGWAKRQEVPEVTKRQLESLIKTEDYLAVFWCKLNLVGICKKWSRGAGFESQQRQYFYRVLKLWFLGSTSRSWVRISLLLFWNVVFLLKEIWDTLVTEKSLKTRQNPNF